MKTTFVFVGSNVSDMMGVVSFRKFGQRADLTDEQARDLAGGGSRIAPAGAFDALGIPAALVQRHAEFGTHGQASPEFASYKAAAIRASEEFLASLQFVVIGPATFPGHFGQHLCLTAAEVKDAIAERIEIVRRRAFDDCQFTAEELGAHACFETHADAAPEFLAKLQEAVQAYQSLCASLQPASHMEEEV